MAKTAYASIGALGLIVNGSKIAIGKKGEKKHALGLENKWHFPGGIMDVGENIEQTAVREVKEELGIDVEVDDLIDVNVVFVPEWKGKAGFAVMAWYTCVPKSVDLEPADDIVDAKWVDIKDLDRYLMPHMKDIVPERCREYLRGLGWK